MGEINNRWLSFLVQQGAQLSDGEPHDIVGFQGTSQDTSLRVLQDEGFICALPGLGLTQASGEDAAHFLHSQLTNDVEHLGNGEARLAAYCSPKGRMLASMLMWRTEQNIFLQLPREIQAALQKRLQMFVLRAKVKLTDVSDSLVTVGLTGKDIPALLAPWFNVFPGAPYAKVESAAGSLIRVADAQGLPRYLWIAPVETAEAAWTELTNKLPSRASAAWRLGDIRAGIGHIVKATQEQFVPQMVNFEVVGGVNFRKGCYPGQEIVARSQYLGKLKRRMVRAVIATQSPVIAGMEVFSIADPEQPCGMIVNAEFAAPGHAECLVEIKMNVLNEGDVRLGSANGPLLKFEPLPYVLPADNAA